MQKQKLLIHVTDENVLLEQIGDSYININNFVRSSTSPKCL